MTASSKICASCSVEKPQTAFHKQGARRHSYCAECYNARYRGKAKRALSDDQFIALCGDVMARIGRRIAVVDALPHHQKAAA